MSDGQGELAPETTDDLVQFLMDNPDVDSDPIDEEKAKPSEESDKDNSDEKDEDATAEDEDDTESEEAKQPSGLKFKVPVKGEDGAESSIEVDEKELIAGYQRHSDYTRKTMELADKEREVTQIVATKLDEGRNHYMQQAQLARAAVLQLAGLRSSQEMAQLAQTDPAQWVQEQQRQAAVNGVLAQLEQGMQHEQQQVQQQTAQQTQQQISKAWGILGQQGLDKPKLLKIYEKVSEKYSIPMESLARVTDPALVMVLRDAVELQGLKDKRASVTAKAKEAPKLPAQRQSVPKSEQSNKRLETRFTSGKAKLNDLAKWIETNNL